MEQVSVQPTKQTAKSSILARNTIFNLLGQGAPLLIAFFAMPVLVHQLGASRLGILTLAWTVTGYFSLFDFGLGRALTQLVAEKMGSGQENEIPATVWTSLLLMFGLALIGGIIVAILTPCLIYHVLNVPLDLQRETILSFYLLAASLPIVITTTGLLGVLEAHQRFDLINIIRISMGIFTYLSPLLVVSFSTNLALIVAVLVAGRYIFWIIHFVFCRSVVPTLFQHITIQRSIIWPLFHFGGWMTVSNVVGPLMVTMDRFLIGSLASVAAVAYYATPYDVITKLWIIPGALVSVLFPAFAANFKQDRAYTVVLFKRGVKYIFLILFPIVLAILTFAYDGLFLWLGSDFAQRSTGVLQWLAIGVLFNSLAQVPFALLQGIGHPDLTAKAHLIELPLYLLALWVLTTTFGIVGTAVTWTARVTVDAILMFVLTHRIYEYSATLVKQSIGVIAVITLIMVLAVTLDNTLVKSLFLCVAGLSFIIGSWFLLLTASERASILQRLEFIRSLRLRKI